MSYIFMLFANLLILGSSILWALGAEANKIGPALAIGFSILLTHGFFLLLKKGDR